MANDIIIPQNFGAISSIFTPDMLDEADEFSAGITGGFGVLTFRGKVWRTKYRGEEIPHLNNDGTPRGAVDLVLVKSSPNKSKIYYPNGYESGSNEAPACSSSNGMTPDIGVEQPQCATCAMCPHDQWGSRITENGKKGKACADSKRVVVAPLDDLANEVYGGPMLLRIPAASLQDLAAYANKMKGVGYPLFLLGTRIRFDVDAEYPKLVFSPIRPLVDEEALFVRALRDDPLTARILNEVEAQVAEQAGSVFEEPPAQPAQRAAAAPRGNVTPIRTAPATGTAARAPAAAPALAPATAKPSVTPRPPARQGGIAAAVARPQPAPPTPQQAQFEDQAAEEEVVQDAAPDEPAGVPESLLTELDAQLEGLL